MRPVTKTGIFVPLKTKRLGETLASWFGFSLV
jgi:hypothetical protein